MQVELLTNDNQKRLMLRSLELKGTSFSCIVDLFSEGFAATRPFYFEQYNLQQFYDQLDLLNKLIPGIARLQGEFEDDYIQLELLKNGHIHVTGEIIQHSELGQHLSFGFQTDQTCIPPLLKTILSILR